MQLIEAENPNKLFEEFLTKRGFGPLPGAHPIPMGMNAGEAIALEQYKGEPIPLGAKNDEISREGLDSPMGSLG